MSSSVALNVAGMTCGHCKMSVEKAVNSVPGVSGVEVDLATKQAKVSGNFDQTAVVKAIEDAGYEVTG